jgi:hypothetical protein
MSSFSISSSAAAATDALLVRDVDGQYRPALAEEVLSHARRVLAHRVRRGATMSSPQAVKDHLRLEIGVLEHEVFCVLFLDAQHRIIALKQMFRGTVTQTSVYPREVVKEALSLNAAAVILAPGPDEVGHPGVAAVVAGRSDLGVQRLGGAPLVLGAPRVDLQRLPKRLVECRELARLLTAPVLRRTIDLAVQPLRNRVA